MSGPTLYIICITNRAVTDVMCPTLCVVKQYPHAVTTHSVMSSKL